MEPSHAYFYLEACGAQHVYNRCHDGALFVAESLGAKDSHPRVAVERCGSLWSWPLANSSWSESLPSGLAAREACGLFEKNFGESPFIGGVVHGFNAITQHIVDYGLGFSFLGLRPQHVGDALLSFGRWIVSDVSSHGALHWYLLALVSYQFWVLTQNLYLARGLRDKQRPSWSMLCFSSRREVLAYCEAVSRIEHVVKKPKVVHLRRIAYDEDGPYGVVVINKVEVHIRMDGIDAVELTKPFPAPNETGGKEAVLVSSAPPSVVTELPHGQFCFMLDDEHSGYGTRVAERESLCTLHQFEAMRSYGGQVYICKGDKKYPITIPEETKKGFPKSSDLTTISLEPAVYSALGIRVAKMAVPLSGPAIITALDQLGRPAASLGKIERDPVVSGVMKHNCATRPGYSGAGVYQNGKLVAVHTGSDSTGKVTNFATSLRYAPEYMKLKRDESHFEDGNFDRDGDYEKALALFNKYERLHQGKDTDLFNASEELYASAKERRYQQNLENQQEIEENMRKLNMGEADLEFARNYFSGQRGVPGTSKKAMRKLGEGAQARVETIATPDIKESKRSSISEPIPGLPVPKSLQVSVSQVSASPGPFVPENEKLDQLISSRFSAMEANLTRSLLASFQSLAATTPPSGVPATSSEVSGIKPASSSKKRIANSKGSKKALTEPSSTTQ